MKTLREYVREQLDGNNNVLITEGKFWDWVKSLFKSKDKKYKDSYDEWLKSVDGAKEYGEKNNKLKNEYSKKKAEILKNINDESSPEDIEKAFAQISELDKKKVGATQKINQENEKLLKDRPIDATIATEIVATTDQIKYLQEYKELYIHFIKCNKKAFKDADELKKRNEESKKIALKGAAESVNGFNILFFKDADEKERKSIINTLKDGKVEKYFTISGDAISLNENEYAKIFDEAAQKLSDDENEKS